MVKKVISDIDQRITQLEYSFDVSKKSAKSLQEQLWVQSWKILNLEIKYLGIPRKKNQFIRSLETLCFFSLSTADIRFFRSRMREE